MEGDLVGLGAKDAILYDMNSPSLHSLFIEGSLIFSDTKDLELRAGYIMIKGSADGKRKALLQVGTEAQPFKHKAVITLEGNRRMRELPVYGAKVLALRFGILDLHGQERFTWTRLSATAPRGATFLDLRASTDWKKGDELVLAPTDYHHEQAEQLVVKSVEKRKDGDRVHLTKALLYDHWGAGYTVDAKGTPHHNRYISEMSAEVGLLSRNVIVQGDEQTYDIQFGAHIFMHSNGDESLLGRLENTEVRMAGQGFFLGRYAVHFHLVITTQP